MTAVPMNPADVARFVRPVPLARQVLVHLRIWRAQRSMVLGSAVALVIAVGAMAIGTATRGGPATADAVGRQFLASMSACSFIFLAVGAVAGAAPFRMRWAELVLSFAPRRGRWFAAALASVLVWAVGIAAVLGVLCAGAAAATLAAGHRDAAGAAGVITHLAPVVVVTLVDMAVGFLLGAAARGVAVPLVLAFVIAPALPLLSVRSLHIGSFLSLDDTTRHVAALDVGWHDLTGLCAWLVAPALIAAWRLRRSPSK
jgi:hypothetical protein